MDWDLYLERIKNGDYDQRITGRNRLVTIQKRNRGSYLKYDPIWRNRLPFSDLVLYDKDHNELIRLRTAEIFRNSDNHYFIFNGELDVNENIVPIITI